MFDSIKNFFTDVKAGIDTMTEDFKLGYSEGLSDDPAVQDAKTKESLSYVYGKFTGATKRLFSYAWKAKSVWLFVITCSLIAFTVINLVFSVVWSVITLPYYVVKSYMAK